MKIFIGAHYNLNNGDRAVLEATVQSLLSLDSSLNITVSAFQPKLLNDERFASVRWALKENRISRTLFYMLCRLRLFKYSHYLSRAIFNCDYLSSLHEADIVLISGGHHMTDILGKKTFYLLASNVIMPVIKKKKVIMLPQSFGPIDEVGALQDLRWLLRRVSSIAYRDKSSGKFLEQFDVRHKTEFVPDMVFAMNKKRKIEPRNKCMGIAMYCNYSGQKRKDLFPFVIEELKASIDSFLFNGYSVNFIPMEVKNSASDDRVYMRLIIDAVSTEYKEKIRIIEPAGPSIMDTIDSFADNDLIIAYKTHSVVFSLISSIPVIAIAYHPKSIEFMESVGLKDYSLTDRMATKENLVRLVNTIESNYDDIVSTEIQEVKNKAESVIGYLVKVLSTVKK
jgi:polysaccharide pyruvyl transferase WcaK-like protein